MRQTLLGFLPSDLRGCRLLDAGCGTGALAVEAARRGADVVAIDLSPTLVKLAQERLPASLGPGRITFRAGDMLDPSLGRFDHVVAMDSVIHYNLPDMVNILARFSAMSDSGVHLHLCPAHPCTGHDARRRQDLSARRPLAGHRSAYHAGPVQGGDRA